ncbi:hypothetical protein Asppvi_009310 [Aspergillus pseudoviridinutans]|uniref:Apple domain-containing protein n=1 Tax=Aspergillus pseudoviridinutans TaxID=1517512 RepID=A0A9P3EW30_9EURO|nr:uncharacterized protein Asppvi_009310 [Aspergillus pseudoviridinutans]GIJ90356.1 hypothetical protein Asppvi_009310 [Aspergillus pseudoviridinutans]
MAAAGAIATQDGGAQAKICPHLDTQDNGCIRYTRGFDVTGVLTTVELPNIENACDCVQACLDRPDTCASYVWKFNDPTSDRRTCTLYSNFNLPAGVDVLYNTTEVPGVNQGLNPISDNPQIGSRVPKATKPNSTDIDEKAISGPVWQLEDGKAQC